MMHTSFFIVTVHAYYRYPDGMKYDSVKEQERWEKKILKKLNETVRTARKRFRRVHNMPGPAGTESIMITNTVIIILKLYLSIRLSVCQ